MHHTGTSVIRSILFWQHTEQRHMVSPASKITGGSKIHVRLDKPPAGPSESPRIFGLTKMLGGYHYRQSRNDNRTPPRSISRKENRKHEMIDKESSRAGNDG
ncbi:hypothetical protein D7V86_23330 [bacterium D16-51]|nr:hypothetical protein D7V96_23355 [bacterium D16-59]RKI54580.1 hypothetical protein D7V86_23330 [bacterium D16-51]